jgi:LytS/YehU family sensor histidine kinase
MILWFVNRLIQDRSERNNSFSGLIKLMVFLLANSVCVFLILWINFHLIKLPLYHSEGDAFVFLFIARIAVALMIIVVVQNTLKSLAEKDAIKLVNEQLRSENLQARFEALKQQINPHFLFNALNTLRIMVRENDPNSEEFVLKLSEIYRELLSKKDLSFIKLEEELHFLEAYLFLIKSRFQEMILLDINILPQSRQLYLPTFSLQLLFENCIKHNVISASRPLVIKIWQDTGDEVCIENKLQPKFQIPEPSGLGLENIKKRYALNGVDNGITINCTETHFRVNLKLLKK